MIKNLPQILISLSVFIIAACDGQKNGPEIGETSESAVASAANELSIRVSLGQMRELAPGQKVGAVYFKLENLRSDAIEIVGASSSMAGFIEIHETSYADGMMAMRPVNSVSIKSGDTKRFEPQGLHLMLFDITHLPSVGESFELELELSSGEKVPVNIEVKKLS